MGVIFSNYVNACKSFWTSNNSSFLPVANPVPRNTNDPDTGFEVAVFNNTSNGNNNGGYNGGNDNPGGLLIVGCNPSGIAIHRNYRNPNPAIQGSPSIQDFYTINTFPLKNNNDIYTQAIEDFAKACGYGNHYYKIDVFGIMQKTQSVLRNDIRKKNCSRIYLYRDLFEIFVDTVIALKPVKIVFANAFVSQLVCDNRNLSLYDITNSQNYSSIRNNHVHVHSTRNNKGGLDITFCNNGKSLKSTAWFSSMLSGQRALDLGNKGLLIWAVQ